MDGQHHRQATKLAVDGVALMAVASTAVFHFLADDRLMSPHF